MNWVAVGSLGTFLTFVITFITIFLKDKHKQEQIDSLTRVAEILQAQNETMKEQNNLIAQQVDIFRNTSLLKGNDNEAIKELGRIEDKRLRLSVMPNLSANIGYQGFSGEMQIYLNNNGEDAKVLEVKSNSDDITLNNFPTPINIDKGRQIQIRGRQAGNKHIKDCEIDIEITYSDKLGNKYVSTIRGTGARVKVAQTEEIN